MRWNFFAKKTDDKAVTGVNRALAYSGGSVVSEDTAMCVSAFNRGVIYVSTQVAKLPASVKGVGNVDVESYLTPFLNCVVNEDLMSSFLFKLVMTQSAIIHGNGYAEIERTYDGKVKNLWPLNSIDVELLRTATGKLVYRCGNVYLPPKDVFHLRNFHTKDGVVGQGVVAYGKDTLGTSLGADKFSNSLFANAGMPSGVLSTASALSDEAYNRIKASWNEAHKGRKAGGVAILEEGLNFSPVTFTPEVMQFLETRKFSVVEIARFLGVPPVKLFDVDTSTYNNVEHAQLAVTTDTLDPWVRNWESEIDIKLLNCQYGGRFSELSIFDIARGDMNTRANYYKSMQTCGAMTANEIRFREGMAGYDDGNRFFVATNNLTPTDKVDEVIESNLKKDTPVEPKETELDKELASYIKRR